MNADTEEITYNKDFRDDPLFSDSFNIVVQINECTAKTPRDFRTALHNMQAENSKHMEQIERSLVNNISNRTRQKTVRFNELSNRF